MKEKLERVQRRTDLAGVQCTVNKHLSIIFEATAKNSEKTTPAMDRWREPCDAQQGTLQGKMKSREGNKYLQM